MGTLGAGRLKYFNLKLKQSHSNTSLILQRFNTRMPNGVKMTPLDSLLVHIFSLACFQKKSSRDLLSFVGPYTVLEWREFLSALKTIF